MDPGTLPVPRAHSSVGRAPARQAGGHRFEPCCAHFPRHVCFTHAVRSSGRMDMPISRAGTRSSRPDAGRPCSAPTRRSADSADQPARRNPWLVPPPLGANRPGLGDVRRGSERPLARCVGPIDRRAQKAAPQCRVPRHDPLLIRDATLSVLLQGAARQSLNVTVGGPGESPRTAFRPFVVDVRARITVAHPDPLRAGMSVRTGARDSDGSVG